LYGNGYLDMPDNGRLRMGASYDLAIFHDSSNSYIQNNGTGSLITNTCAFLLKSANNSEFMMTAYQDGAVNLFHNNITRLSTTASGVDVTGTINFAGGASTGNLSFGDSNQLQLGTGNDLRMYHSGTHGFITNNVSGSLYIQSGNSVQIESDAGENMIVASANGAVELYHDNSNKLSTTASGVAVTNTLDVGSFIYVGGNDSIFAENNLRFKSAGAAYIDHNTVSQSIKFRLSNSSSLDVTPFELTPSYLSSTVDMYFGDNDKIRLGAGSDLQIYHDGSNSYIKDAGTGTLNLQRSSQVNICGANGEIGIQYVENANVTLRHNNVANSHIKYGNYRMW